MHMYRKAHETRIRGALLHDLLRIKERARRTQDARTAVVKYSGRARPTRTLYIRNRQCSYLHHPPQCKIRAPCAEVCRTALAGGRSGLELIRNSGCKFYLKSNVSRLRTA